MAKQVMCAKHPKDPCWICTKPPVKYAVRHHVMGTQVDPDLTVDLCRGCHMLEKYLSQRKFLDNAAAVGRLITLARFHAGLPDARTIVIFEDDEYKEGVLARLAIYFAGANKPTYGKIYDIFYPHTKAKEEHSHG